MDSSALPPSLDALEAAARAKLPAAVYDYYAGGADDELTLAANRSAFDGIFFSPRVLVDVDEIDTRSSLLGDELETPILLAPTAFQKLSDPEGELATVRASGAAGTVMVASTMSSYTIEEIMAEASGPVWLQLYVFRERDLTEELIRRAESAGASALCLTLTVPVIGNRERDMHHSFTLPDDVDMANFRGFLQERFPDADGSKLEAYIGQQFDASLTWESLDWLRGVSDLPIVLKGVMTSDDGARAVHTGADAVIVSNHGGRQLDGAEPTIRALPRVIDGVGGRIPVLVDGGIRRGRDVVKALALGAQAVLIGRPYLWGLAVGGEDGVRHVIDLLQRELERTMALVGRTRLTDLRADVIAGGG